MKHDHVLKTKRLIIRSWKDCEQDRIFFHHIFSDPEMLEFFPWSFSRVETDHMFDRMLAAIASDGFGWGVAELKDSGKPIGFTGLSQVRFEADFAPAVEIGWRYTPQMWGQGFATEAGHALIKHGFDDLALKRIVSFAVRDNLASIAVMKRLGMQQNMKFDFDHPRVPSDQPHLIPHVFYEISS